LLQDLNALNTDNIDPVDHITRLEPVIFLTTFKLFVDSSYFSQWLAANRASVSNISCERWMMESVRTNTSLAPQQSFLGEGEGEGNDSRGSSSSSSSGDFDTVDIRTTTREVSAKLTDDDDVTMPKQPSHNDGFVDTAISCLENSDFNRIIRSESWLSSLLAAAESLPVPFSISSASKLRFGFPLIYVNPRFEVLTGYGREEIIGRNCRFLQDCNICVYSEEFMSTTLQTNERKLVQLRDVLKAGCPSTVELSNFRKDGSHFRNYLLLKPIYDQHKQYRYVVGLQFEVTSPQQKLSNRNLFNLLPDQIFIEKDDEEDDTINAIGAK
jgi:PAS domain S-box-containing protein